MSFPKTMTHHEVKEWHYTGRSKTYVQKGSELKKLEKWLDECDLVHPIISIFEVRQKIDELKKE